MSARKGVTDGEVGKRKDTVLRLTRMAGKVLLSPFFRLETSGQDNLPTESAFVLLPKHQRWEDIPLLALATPRPLYYMAKYELFLNPFLAWFLASLGGIPLNRLRPVESRRSLKAMIAVLRKGEGVVVFPEGTYYREGMGKGHAGLIRMVRSRLTLPFIPVGIRYAGKSWRKDVLIRFGRPIYEDASSKTADLLDQCMKEIARLSCMEDQLGEGASSVGGTG